MLANERQQLIRELINSQKNLRISDLSGILGVSDIDRTPRYKGIS